MTNRRYELEDLENYWNNLNYDQRKNFLYDLRIPDKYLDKEFAQIHKKFTHRIDANILYSLRHRENHQHSKNNGNKNYNSNPERNFEVEDYYDLLGVSKDAVFDEIKTRYRELSQKFHPDKEHAGWSTDLMKKINEAYEVLSNTNKRSEYDSSL